MNLKSLLLLPLLAASVSITAFAEEAKPKPVAPKGAPEGFQTLNIGDAAPNFSLIGIDDKKHTLADYADAKVLVITFISNHCPTSQAAEGRIKKLVADYASKGVQVLAINPNHPDALRPDELGYSIYNDGFEDMKLHAKEQGFDFPYLYDGETQAVSKAFGCLATPHIFVFDADRKLRYKGYFDESRFADAATVKKPATEDAVKALLAGQDVAVPETRPHGCSTKWLTKKEEVAKDHEKWQKASVDVEMINAEGVAALRKNGTKKVRLFNVWATYCGPCVKEFPLLTAAARKFGLRDFELITISLDDPADKDAVKAFLEKQQASIPDKIKPTLKAEGRTTNSYIYEGDPDALIAALDTEWPGPTPHTVLVAPDGSVVWRHNGELEGNQLQEEILKHLGRYYQPE